MRRIEIILVSSSLNPFSFREGKFPLYEGEGARG